jgi:hypothetical protein
MYPTSAEFKEAVYAPVRSSAMRVTFDITDVTAYDDVDSISAADQEAVISNVDQISDRERVPSTNIATHELGRFKLDGSFSFPSSTAALNGEVGYVSDSLSGADGFFAVPLRIDIAFTGYHSSAGLTITFDPVNNEWAEDFAVTVYDVDMTEIAYVHVTGNTNVIAEPLGNLSNYTFIRIDIEKWCKPNRRGRVIEVDYGIVRVYADDSLTSASWIEELDMFSATGPASEFIFSIDNSGREFNILNPTGFYAYLQERQKVYVDIGVQVESSYQYVPLGEFYLADWTSEDNSMIATFKAQSIVDLMASYDYEQLTSVSRTPAAFIAYLFSLCGVTDYYIDPTISTTPLGCRAKRTDCKTALFMMASAYQCNVFITRSGQVRVVKMVDGAAVDRIDFDNTYTEPKVELDRPVRLCVVTYWTSVDTVGGRVTVPTMLNTGDILELANNTFIETASQASQVANWMTDQAYAKAKYSIDWRGNPAHELMDYVGIENSYGDDKEAWLTRIELNYDGALRGRTQARGII